MPPGKLRFRYKTKDRGDHDIDECNHTIHGKYIHDKPFNSKVDKELVPVRQMKDMRDIIVASREPLVIPGVLPKSEFLRLRKQAYVVSPEEKKAIIQESIEKKNKLIQESMERRNKLSKTKINEETKHSILDEVESEAAKKHNYLLQRANEMRQEQEDEVKGINRIILASKCLAIREAQIAEKELIKRELDDEDKRLDKMMEQQRQLGLHDDKKKREQAEERTRMFVAQIKEQLKEHEIQQLIEKEHREEEARVAKNLMVQLKEEEKLKFQTKVLKQKQMQNELHTHNMQAEQYREMQREEERLHELRLREFMRKKNEREEALENERKANQKAREREIAKIRDNQEKQTDILAKRDEMNAFRLQEEAEREWRRKEKEKAIKKLEANAQLKRDREKQIDDIRKAQALELARDQEEFHKVAKLQYETFLKEEEKRKVRRENNEKHRREILKQVNERELCRIQTSKEELEQGNAARMEEEMRDMRIKETLQKKLEELKKCHVPEQTLIDVQRQINITLSKQKK